MTQSASSRDALELAEFGYRQRLERSLGGFSSFASGFSYLSILTGLPQLFYLGFGAAGPAFFWTWPAVFLGQFLVALCFAELAARYPLSGGVYQWARQVGPAWVGGMAGWVYLACAVISLASVALALQATLPRIAPRAQIVGHGSNPADAAANAVILGCGLIALSTLINALGVRLLARINNVGVFAEMAGVVLLIALLASRARRGPSVVFELPRRGLGSPLGSLGPLLAAALVPSFVFYGFDTAGSLAEETEDPRRRAPRAILGALASVGLAGSLLILASLCASGDLTDPGLGKVGGGMPAIIQEALGDRLGSALLAVVVLAISVCALTVHAAAVRLVFAMARDGVVPFSGALARVSESTGTPVLPAALVGAGAALILLANSGLPEIIEVLASVAIAWANLAYLFVTVPTLLRRLRRGGRGRSGPGRYFSLGRLGLPINAAAVAWGVLMVVNVSWPRPEIYGPRRFAGLLASASMLAAGGLYFALARRRGAEILEEHRAVGPAPGLEIAPIS